MRTGTLVALLGLLALATAAAAALLFWRQRPDPDRFPAPPHEFVDETVTVGFAAPAGNGAEEASVPGAPSAAPARPGGAWQRAPTGRPGGDAPPPVVASPDAAAAAALADPRLAAWARAHRAFRYEYAYDLDDDRWTLRFYADPDATRAAARAVVAGGRLRELTLPGGVLRTDAPEGARSFRELLRRLVRHFPIAAADLPYAWLWLGLVVALVAAGRGLLTLRTLDLLALSYLVPLVLAVQVLPGPAASAAAGANHRWVWGGIVAVTCYYVVRALHEAARRTVPEGPPNLRTGPATVLVLALVLLSAARIWDRPPSPGDQGAQIHASALLARQRWPSSPVGAAAALEGDALAALPGRRFGPVMYGLLAPALQVWPSVWPAGAGGRPRELFTDVRVQDLHARYGSDWAARTDFTALRVLLTVALIALVGGTMAAGRSLGAPGIGPAAAAVAAASPFLGVWGLSLSMLVPAAFLVWAFAARRHAAAAGALLALGAGAAFVPVLGVPAFLGYYVGRGRGWLGFALGFGVPAAAALALLPLPDFPAQGWVTAAVLGAGGFLVCAGLPWLLGAVATRRWGWAVLALAVIAGCAGAAYYLYERHAAVIDADRAVPALVQTVRNAPPSAAGINNAWTALHSLSDAGVLPDAAWLWGETDLFGFVRVNFVRVNLVRGLAALLGLAIVLLYFLPRRKSAVALLAALIVPLALGQFFVPSDAGGRYVLWYLPLFVLALLAPSSARRPEGEADDRPPPGRSTTGAHSGRGIAGVPPGRGLPAAVRPGRGAGLRSPALRSGSLREGVESARAGHGLEDEPPPTGPIPSRAALVAEYGEEIADDPFLADGKR